MQANQWANRTTRAWPLACLLRRTAGAKGSEAKVQKKSQPGDASGLRGLRFLPYGSLIDCLMAAYGLTGAVPAATAVLRGTDKTREMAARILTKMQPDV